MTPADTQGANAAAGTVPDIKTMLCPEEEQAQQDADAPMKALERRLTASAKSWRARDRQET